MKSAQEKRRAATERQRQWRAQNPEKSRAASARYRAKNVEKSRARYAKWRASNPDKASAASARWRRQNRDRARELGRKWARLNAEKMRALRRQQYKQNRIARRIKEREVRAAMKRRLVDLMGGQCRDCGFDGHLAVFEFDHINDDKECNVGSLLNSSDWTRLWREASKCELVCSNCHKVRHYKRTDAKFACAAA